AANPELASRELLSALADGELQGAELACALDLCAHEDSHSTWEVYHLVGDVLRSPDLAQPVSTAFMSRLREEIARQALPVGAPLAEDVPRRVAGAERENAANASVFRWKMAAGFASLAAVAAVGWSSLTSLQTGGQVLAGAAPQLAPAVTPTATAADPAAPVVAVADADGQQIMIRDPRLDELLAAHRQFGGTAALQMPAGFLRNATFESPGR
ncbi:MAG: sigma-E factor negative regulatory protein, partial [Acidovorax sp.]